MFQVAYVGLQKRFHTSGVKASTFQSLYEVSFLILDEFLSESPDDIILQSDTSALKSNERKKSEEVNKGMRKQKQGKKI